MQEKSTLKQIAKSGLFVSGITIICKIAGLLKQSVVAYIFGASGNTDVTFAAVVFINFFSTSIWDSVGTILTAEYIREENKNKLIISHMLLNIVIALMLTFLVVIMSGALAYVVGGGYTSVQKKDLKESIMIMSCTFITYAIIQIYGAVLNANKEFVSMKLYGIFNAVAIICACLLLQDTLDTKAIILGHVIGEFGFVIFAVFRSKKYIKWCRITIKNIWHALKLFKEILPVIIGTMAIIGSNLIDRFVASYFDEGTASCFYYGQILSYNIAYDLIVTALGVIFYTYFVEYVRARKYKEMNELIGRVVIFFVLIYVIVVVWYMFLSKGIVNILLGHGKLEQWAVHDTAQITFAYAIGFFPMAIREILIKSHYAFEDTKAVLVNSIVGTIANIVVSIVLSYTIGGIGIAIGTSVSFFVIAGMSMITVRKYGISIKIKKIGKLCCKAICAAGIASIFLAILTWKIQEHGLILVLFGGMGSLIIYIFMLWILRVKEIDNLFQIILLKLGRNIE